MKNSSRIDLFEKIIERIKCHCNGDLKFLKQIFFDLLDTEMERDAYKVLYNFLSQHTGLKAYLDGNIEKITKGE